MQDHGLLRSKTILHLQILPDLQKRFRKIPLPVSRRELKTAKNEPSLMPKNEMNLGWPSKSCVSLFPPKIHPKTASSVQCGCSREDSRDLPLKKADHPIRHSNAVSPRQRWLRIKKWLVSQSYVTIEQRDCLMTSPQGGVTASIAAQFVSQSHWPNPHQGDRTSFWTEPRRG